MPVSPRARLRHRDHKTIITIMRAHATRFIPYTRLVGRWLWIEGALPENRDEAKALWYLGFHWNRARQVWQHPCGQYRSKASANDPREKYGQLRLDELEASHETA